MITVCPDCHTAFRITDEQLAARDGRVRCGKCSAVFDARESLRPADFRQESGNGLRTPSELPEFDAISPALPAAPDANDAQRKYPAPTLAQTPSVEPQEAEPPPPDPDVIAPEPEPRRAWRRAGWVAASTLLVVALTAQAAFHYRGEIAVLFPQIRPLVVEFCASLACDIPLPRRAELISIESSDLQADPANPNVMVLTATLRNRAAFPQSYPLLELTLTNPQDQALARRVLGTRDYLAPGASTGAGFAANSELHLKVLMDASSLKATGYRLYLFFP